MIISVRAEWIMVVVFELADVTCQYKNFSKYITYSFTTMCSSIWNRSDDVNSYTNISSMAHTVWAIANYSMSFFYIKCITHDFPLYDSYVCDTLVINITRYISDDECTAYHNLILHPATETRTENIIRLFFSRSQNK